MKIIFHNKFDKQFQVLHQKIKNQFYVKLSIFEKDPFSQGLRNHQLKWKYKNNRSIDITWDYREIFLEKSDWKYKFVEFIKIWTHS